MFAWHLEVVVVSFFAQNFLLATLKSYLLKLIGQLWSVKLDALCEVK